VKGFNLMYRKFNALFLSFAIMLAMFLGLGGRPARAAAATPASPAAAGAQLLSVLPTSDLVLYVDTQRLLNDAIPAFLATKPDLLAKMNASIDKMRLETGIDLRSFDMMVVGVRYGSSGLTKDVKTVVLTRVHFDSGAIINAGFAAAAKDKNMLQRQSQEEYKGKTLYVVGPSASKATTSVSVRMESKNQGTKATRGANSVAAQDEPPPKPIALEKTAVTALDSNTIAGGDIESVRAVIDAEAGGQHVDDELVQLATRNASALVGFSGKQPAPGMRLSGQKDNSQAPYTTALEGIQQFYGSLSTSGTDTEAALNLRMQTPEQARVVKEMVDIFKPANSATTNPASPDMFPAFSNLFKSLTVNIEGNEVQMQLKLTQADLAPFLQRM
jgi:hypothetical protein